MKLELVRHLMRDVHQHCIGGSVVTRQDFTGLERNAGFAGEIQALSDDMPGVCEGALRIACALLEGPAEVVLEIGMGSNA